MRKLRLSDGFLLAYFALCLSTPLWAQNSIGNGGSAVTTYPLNTGIDGTNTGGGPLPLTNNLAIAANAARRGCFIQNNGTHNMSIATNSGMTNAVTLVSGASFNCAIGGIVIGDPIYITGTAADTVAVWWQ